MCIIRRIAAALRHSPSAIRVLPVTGSSVHGELRSGLPLALQGCSSRDAERGAPPAAPAASTSGMVSSAHPLATQAGLEILAKGGNAFDAAVAVAATLNVVEPMMSGAGGYGTIMVYHRESGRARFLNTSDFEPPGNPMDAFPGRHKLSGDVPVLLVREGACGPRSARPGDTRSGRPPRRW